MNNDIIHKKNLITITFTFIIFTCGFILVYSEIANAENNFCPICGMAWDGETTGIIDEETYYYCCPVCALKHVVPRIDGDIFGKCNTTGENITINILDGNASLVIPNTTVVSLGGTCPTNKLFKNETVAFSFNSSRPALSIQQVIDQKVNPPVEEPDSGETDEDIKDTPGFELVILISVIAFIFILKRKRKK